MLFPLGTDRPLRSRTVVTYALLAANILIFLAQFSIQRTDPNRLEHLLNTFMVCRHAFHWWQLISASFLHADWWHLAGNALFLWTFGPNLEDRFGKLWFLLFYLLGGAAAMLAHIAVSHSPALGASGSIAACTGAYLIMFPRTNIKVYGIFWGSAGFAWIAAWWIIGLGIVWDIAGGLSGFGRVAHGAHLGGTTFGAAISFFLLWRKIIPREPYDLFTHTRQAYRRSLFRSAQSEFQRTVHSKVGSASASQPAQDELSKARASVTAFVSAGDFAGATAAYKKLADTYGHLPRAACLGRDKQLDLANAMYRQGDFVSAAYAYERFLEAFAKDPQAPEIRLLLGRLIARHLNDPVRAKSLLKLAYETLWDEKTKALAKDELDALREHGSV